MTKPPPAAKIPGRPPTAISLSDIRGLSQLGFDATLGITDLVEQMHRNIARGSAIVGQVPPGRTGGITGAVYGAVRGTTKLVGKGVGAAMGLVDRGVANRSPGSTESPASPRREAALAALNGIFGDHLVATDNPLAITMSMRLAGQRLSLTRDALAQALPAATGRVLVLVHGLCMNDLQWTRNAHHHGAELQSLGYTPVALHYNSGRHVSENGRDFARLLDELVTHWPVPVQELVLLAHSMGGLVSRSACHFVDQTLADQTLADQALADQERPAWRSQLTRLVCLGTPHHGAALERGGRLVDAVFGVSPYVAPFAKLTQARSAGITDLRYGNVQDADWQGREAGAQTQDDRHATPLPAGVKVFLVAATVAKQAQGLRHALVGDGLVSLASAWGEHADKARVLTVPASRRLLVTSANHWDLLDRPEVTAQLRHWLR